MEENKEEKKKTRISLWAVICIFLIFVMGLAIIYLCVAFANKKVEDAKQIDKLNNDLKTSQEVNQKLQGTITDLQGKIDELDDAINDVKPTAAPDTTPTAEPVKEKDTETRDLTDKEKEEIEEFINDIENTAFIYALYANPMEAITEEPEFTYAPGHTDKEKNIRLLRYSINASKYTEGLGGDVDGFSMTVENMQKYLKEKLNYDFSESDIKQYFPINKENGKIEFVVSDALFGASNYPVLEGKKENGKYIVIVNREKVKVEVTLTKENGNYYFYSCEEV